MFEAGKWRAYVQLMRLDRPIGTLLLLYPTLWAVWLSANGRPSASVFWLFVVGVFVMRSAGCVINDYADRDFDGHVERTQQRPLATGVVSANEAVALFIALLIIALLLVLFLEVRLLGLAVIGAFLAGTYPFLKRFTHLPQFYLGVAFGWGIPMAYFAHQGAFPPDCWWLFVANVFWATAYDTEYAMVDREDDLKIGVKSTAILFGDFDRKAILILHGLTILCLIQVGRLLDLGVWYFFGLVLATGLALYQQHLLKNRERNACFRAFLNNNWLGAAVLFGLILDYTLV